MGGAASGCDLAAAPQTVPVRCAWCQVGQAHRAGEQTRQAACRVHAEHQATQQSAAYASDGSCCSLHGRELRRWRLAAWHRQDTCDRLCGGSDVLGGAEGLEVRG